MDFSGWNRWLMRYNLSLDALPLLSKQSQNPTQLLITLNTHISKLTLSHRYTDALRLFSGVHSSPHLAPDHYTLTSTLTACAALRSATLGAQLHALALRSGLLSDTHVANSLLSFYAKSHRPDTARRLFDTLPVPDVYSRTILLSSYCKAGKILDALNLFDEMPKKETALWNAVITGCMEHGYHGFALELFVGMHQLGVAHDHYTFASVIGSCDSAELVGLGRQVHSMVIRTGFIELKVSVINALVTMYFNCGLISNACELFSESKIRDQITYNASIAGLARWGRYAEALIVYKEMREEACLQPTELTFVSALAACPMKAIGVQVHAQVIRLGLEASTLVGNAVMNMYGDFGNLLSARQVFENIDDKDIISWNSMISGYSQENCYESAFDVYHRMQEARIEPDDFTYGSLITCSWATTHAGMIQGLIAKNGHISSSEVCNAMISTYAKCGEMDCAYQVFDGMTFRNLITWNSILSGCLLNGLPVRGLESFSTLMKSGLKPNSCSLSTVLSICLSISALRYGKQIHGYILRSGCERETLLGNSLITMYAKCGDLDCCTKVFYGMSRRDVVSWNAIIAAYAQNGDGHEAIRYFKELQDSEELPDEVTFTIVLSACSHAGLVEDGHLIFSSMVEDYSIEPGVDHYSCVIDLLGRAGHLDEAERLINSMPYQVDSHIWWALLSACCNHRNVRLGRIAARSLLETEPDNPAVYILLSNINAADGKWDEASTVREQMRKNGVIKRPGFSWIGSESGSDALTL